MTKHAIQNRLLLGLLFPAILVACKIEVEEQTPEEETMTESIRSSEQPQEGFADGGESAKIDPYASNTSEVSIRMCFSGKGEFFLADGMLNYQQTMGGKPGTALQCDEKVKSSDAEGVIEINGELVSLSSFPIKVSLMRLGRVGIKDVPGKANVKNGKILLEGDGTGAPSFYYFVIFDDEEFSGEESIGGEVPTPADDAPGAGFVTLYACVDGSDYLVITDGNLSIEHRLNDELGKHPLCPAPYAGANGKFFVGSTAYTLQDVNVPLPAGASLQNATRHLGRGEVSYIAGKLLINDDEFSGPAIYAIRIPVAM